MKRINKTYENSIIINKSEFICHLYRVDSVDEVENILATTRKKYYDATHNCYAYILGDNQEIQKSSDDGEPQKTAGAPMMDALKKNNMTNILAIVTRYFGGILLGAGGLVRAYSQSVSECLKNCSFYEISLQRHITLTTSYAGYNTIIKAIPYLKIINTSFTNDVIIDASIPEGTIDKLNDDLYRYKINPESLKILDIIPSEILIDTSI